MNSKNENRLSFIFFYIINMIFNWKGLLPGIILLVLHFYAEISIWWAVGAFVLWFLWIFVIMKLLGWVSRAGGEHTTPQKSNSYDAGQRTANANPYSVGRKNISQEAQNDSVSEE